MPNAYPRFLGVRRARDKMYGLPAFVFMITTMTRLGTLVGSRHDLSTVDTPEVCAFCHAPHNAEASAANAAINHVQSWHGGTPF